MAYNREQQSKYYLKNRQRRIAYQRQWRLAHPELRRRYEVKYRYGISHKDHEDLLIAQGGCCRICRERFIKTPLVDHNHTTKKVRGLLCHNCNFLVGHARENLEILKAAVLYLENYG